MKNLRFLRLYCGAVCLLFLFSCSKDGEQGPIGPQGPQGEQGTQGPQGEPGEDGEPGTANVFYSDWITADFESSTADSMFLGDFSINPAADNYFNTNTDVLLVYGRHQSGPTQTFIYQLPYMDGSGPVTYSNRLATGIGFTTLFVDADALGDMSDFDFFEDFRYINIRGGQSIDDKSSVPNYTKMTYEEVTNLFNIKD